MMPLYVFLATFVTVFALGFQSQNVNKGHRFMAMLTSFFIGGSNLVLLKVIPTADPVTCGAYLLAGPLAINASMEMHQRYRAWLQRRNACPVSN